MERPIAWKKYDEDELVQVQDFARGYRKFISENKTERECVDAIVEEAQRQGYRPLPELVKLGQKLVPGTKVWASTHGKAIMLVHVGSKPLSEGMTILGAHIDSPRLDIKQNPLYENGGLAYLDTHYYGGIKKYQWTAVPMAIHGVVAKKDQTVIPVVIGESDDEPAFCISDLLIHLANTQMDKKASHVVEGEDLDILVGSQPLPKKVDDDVDDAKEKGSDKDSDESEDKKPDGVTGMILRILKEKYGIEDEDFLSSELEVVPAGPARDMGLDSSMVLGYGHDDRVCAYASFMAQFAAEQPEKTAVCILVDKEEIGSVGASGMGSRFFEDIVAELLALQGAQGDLPLRRALRSSSMLSSDVSAGYDPTYASVFDTKNVAYLGRGLVLNKYTGARGKNGSNDADAEYVARVRAIMDDANVSFQTAELGKVDAGGGGTIAYLPAQYGMDVIDAGIAVLSMHAPWEIISKADLFEAYKGYRAFLQHA